MLVVLRRVELRPAAHSSLQHHHPQHQQDPKPKLYYSASLHVEGYRYIRSTLGKLGLVYFIPGKSRFSIGQFFGANLKATKNPLAQNGLLTSIKMIITLPEF